MAKLFRYSIIFFIYRLLANAYAKIKFDVLLGRNVYLNFNSVFEGKNVLQNKVQFTNSYIGLATYIGNNSVISHTRIGRFCAIGDNVRTCLGIHPTKEWVSIHPAFYSQKMQAGFTFSEENLIAEHQYVDYEKKYVVKIGNDVWIANNVSILDGVTIGDGAIVGLGSVVTRDLEPYSINIGVPARKIGYRFNEKQRKTLLELKWWGNSFEWIKKNASLFNNVDNFIN